MKRFSTNVFLSLGLVLASCESFLDIDISPQLIETEDVFKSVQTARSAVDGVYVNIRSTSPSMLNGALSIFCGLMADELVPSTDHVNYSPFFENNVLSNHSVVRNQFWTVSYQTVFRTNSILQRLEDNVHLPAELKSRLIGEMKTVRALTYFYLVNLFGDVPLIMGTDYDSNAKTGRTSTQEVLRQVCADLLEAVELLPESYPNNTKNAPNKYSGLALLARVYLFQEEFEKAESVASRIIESKVYTLESDLNRVFEIGSEETIWEIAPPGGMGNTAEASSFLPPISDFPSQIGLYTPFVASFDQADLRKETWIGQMEYDSGDFYYPRKYKNASYAAVTEHNIVQRLAELYLIRAEARMNLGNANGAIDDINLIRQRAGLEPIVGSGEDEVFDMIKDERQKELFAEWGHRWFDLKRWSMAGAVLENIKPLWESTRALLPIPDDQLIYNPYLIQNPGY